MSDIAVGLVTYYPLQTDVRRVLALSTLEMLVSNNFKVVVIDGGSDVEFITQIKKLGITAYSQKTKGLRNAKKECYQKLYETEKEVLVCMEPEKEDFVKNILKLANYLINNSLDFLIPGRKDFSSYSRFQAKTEELLNFFYKEYTCLDFDFCFGPLIWKRENTPYLLKFEQKVEEAYWDIQIIPPLQAKKEGLKVEQIRIDFTYYIKMKEEEESSLSFAQKRILQLDVMTKALTVYPELRFMGS